MKCRWHERYQRSTRFPFVRTNGDKPALDRRAERLAQRIQGIGIWIAYALLPMLPGLSGGRRLSVQFIGVIGGAGK